MEGGSFKSHFAFYIHVIYSFFVSLTIYIYIYKPMSCMQIKFTLQMLMLPCIDSIIPGCPQHFSNSPTDFSIVPAPALLAVVVHPARVVVFVQAIGVRPGFVRRASQSGGCKCHRQDSGRWIIGIFVVWQVVRTTDLDPED
jgi:hypothetical protein